MEASEAPVIAFRDAAEFEAWLDAHVDLQVGVWLKIAKKGSRIPSLTADEAVDIGLCYGWISGQRKSYDETHYLQKYVPRRPRSRWSQINVAKVEALTAAGRMRPSGLAEVEAAKADGRWDAADESQRKATIPMASRKRPATTKEERCSTTWDSASATMSGARPSTRRR